MNLKKGMLAAVFGIAAAVSSPACGEPGTGANAAPTVSSAPLAATMPWSLDCNHRSDTAPAASVTESVPFAGKYITLTIPKQPRNYTQAQVRQQVMSALDNINGNAGKVSAEDIKVLQNINNIILSDLISRSGVEEKSGVFFLKIEEAMHQSIGYLSSSIAHDSFHIEQYKRGGYAASRSTQAEVEAIDFQLKLLPAFTIDAKGLNFLRSYQNNPAAINKRRQPGQCD